MNNLAAWAAIIAASAEQNNLRRRSLTDRGTMLSEDMTTNQTGTTQDAREHSSSYMALIRYSNLMNYAMHAMRLHELQETFRQLYRESNGTDETIPDMEEKIALGWMERKGHIAAMRNMDPPISYVEIARIIGVSATRARIIGVSATRAREIGRKV